MESGAEKPMAQAVRLQGGWAGVRQCFSPKGDVSLTRGLLKEWKPLLLACSVCFVDPGCLFLQLGKVTLLDR